MKAVVMVESSREISGKIEQETRFYLTSLLMLAHLIGPAIRSHWAIENSLHWVMDMLFRDDECRVRTNHAPANFTPIKHMAHKPATQGSNSHFDISVMNCRSGSLPCGLW
jgi:predicted transposase YbfD/YdcC